MVLVIIGACLLTSLLTQTRQVSKQCMQMAAEGAVELGEQPGSLAVNESFTPDPMEIERAKGILLALEEAAERGQGAATYEGRLVDIASIRQARALVAKAERLRQWS